MELLILMLPVMEQLSTMDISVELLVVIPNSVIEQSFVIIIVLILLLHMLMIFKYQVFLLLLDRILIQGRFHIVEILLRKSLKIAIMGEMQAVDCV